MGNTCACARQLQVTEVNSNSVEKAIEQSKLHWSLLAEPDAIQEDEEVAEVSNVEVFKKLKCIPPGVVFSYEEECSSNSMDHFLKGKLNGSSTVLH